MSQGIYRITNLINGREYIGQSVNIETRWKTHISTSKNKKRKYHNYPLYKAMRKYGLENFKFEILELVPDKSVLLKKEQYHYELSNHEYNQQYPESFVSKKTRAVYQIDKKTLEVIQEFESITKASLSLNGTESSTNLISFVCKRKKYSTGGYFWCYKEDYTKDWKPIEYTWGTSIKIIQYSLKGDFIKEYISGADASRKTKIGSTNINHCLTGKNKTAGGYIWKYKEVEV